MVTVAVSQDVELFELVGLSSGDGLEIPGHLVVTWGTGDY